MLSIIIPTFNEGKNNFLPAILKSLAPFANQNAIEVICVDSNSCDNTCAIIEDFPVTLIQIEHISRGARMDAGLKAAKGNKILLHHPRTLLNPEGIEYLINNDITGWGGFTHCFDHPHPMLRYISWYSNQVRLKKKSIVYLDHCIFMSRSLADYLSSIPHMQIFEDTEISYKLREKQKAKLLPFKAKTSAIRFIENGIFKQYCSNQILKVCHKLGVADTRMNTYYERNIALNSNISEVNQSRD